MSKYIDADKLIDKFVSRLSLKSVLYLLPEEQVLVKVIDEMEPADVVEVVRCKDCMHWREDKFARKTQSYIPFCTLNATYTEPDHFCAYGEKVSDG